MTTGNIIRRVRFECWITQATNTLSEHVILIVFHCENDYANALNISVKNTVKMREIS